MNIVSFIDSRTNEFKENKSLLDCYIFSIGGFSKIKVSYYHLNFQSIVAYSWGLWMGILLYGGVESLFNLDYWAKILIFKFLKIN